MVTAPSSSMSGAVRACALTQRRLIFSSRRVAALNLAISNSSIPNAFTIRMPLKVSCRTLLISAILSWLWRLEVRMYRPIREDGKMTNGTRRSEISASRQSR